MDEGSEVYLVTDRKRRVMGIIVKNLGGKPGKRRFTVAWIGTGGKPTDHDEADLVAAPVGATNVIRGNVGGSVVQANNIKGGVHFNTNNE